MKFIRGSMKKKPECKIGFSTFAKLRPKECVLAGAAGTHTVCVCLKHENVKLMFAGSNLHLLTNEKGESVFPTYRDCLKKSLCEPPSEECFLGRCHEELPSNSRNEAMSVEIVVIVKSR